MSNNEITNMSNDELVELIGKGPGLAASAGANAELNRRMIVSINLFNTRSTWGSINLSV